MKPAEPLPDEKQSRWKTWLKRFGIVGFLFFLAKGLAWLAIGYFGLKACG